MVDNINFYDELLMKYAFNRHTPWCTFDEFVINSGYKFSVRGNLFDSMNDCFSYMQSESKRLRKNIGFEIIKV